MEGETAVVEYWEGRNKTEGVESEGLGLAGVEFSIKSNGWL